MKFVPLDVWAGDFFNWHAGDYDRKKQMRAGGYDFIVDVYSDLRGDAFIQPIDESMGDDWTFCTEVIHCSGFRHTVGFRSLRDATMAKLVL
jgi:hypothetical protein